MLIDALVYFNRTINHLIGTNANSLFGMENVTLRKNEIFVNNKKGLECGYKIEHTSKWPLGKFILDRLVKQNSDDVRKK